MVCFQNFLVSSHPNSMSYGRYSFYYAIFLLLHDIIMFLMFGTYIFLVYFSHYPFYKLNYKYIYWFTLVPRIPTCLCIISFLSSIINSSMLICLRRLHHSDYLWMFATYPYDILNTTAYIFYFIFIYYSQLHLLFTFILSYSLIYY